MHSSVPQGLLGMQGGGPTTSAAQRDRMLSETQRLQASSQSLDATRGVLNQAQVGVGVWRRANFTTAVWAPPNPNPLPVPKLWQLL